METPPRRSLPGADPAGMGSTGLPGRQVQRAPLALPVASGSGSARCRGFPTAVVREHSQAEVGWLMATEYLAQHAKRQQLLQVCIRHAATQWLRELPQAVDQMS
jgi:hypothetical protein